MTNNGDLFQKIDTIIFRVTDLRKACEWYQTALGLHVAWVDEKQKSAVLDVGGSDGVPLTLREMRPEERNGGARGPQNYPILHPHAHIELTYATMRERGIRVEPIVGEPGHTRSFFFSDPDGNRLEVAQY